MIEDQYKNETIYLRAHSVPWHPKLLEIDLWIKDRFGVLVCTSSWRPGPIHEKDSGIHMTIPCRAKDLRSRDTKDPESVPDVINGHWIYDPQRPSLKVCVYHDTGQGAHFHIQVHDRTMRK